jgi:hypothetical protein
MSVQGIGPGAAPQWLRAPETSSAPQQSEGAGRAREQQAQPPRVGSEAALTVAPPSPGHASAAGSAPEGVDAELWSLLTTEERGHFARFAAMGGVTYGPGAGSPSRPLASGHRLDLKV